MTQVIFASQPSIRFYQYTNSSKRDGTKGRKPKMNSLTAKKTAIANQQFHNDSVFPHVIQCQDANCDLETATEWIQSQSRELLTLATAHGAVLLRDFPVTSAENFDSMVTALGLPNFPYEQSLSNAVRVNRTERVFSANEAPPEVQIFFHHEMAQTPLYPRWIFFSCEVAAEQGGATPICRSDILLEKLRDSCPDFIEACEQKGLRYTNIMPSNNDANSGMGRSWKSTLGVEDQEAAEKRLRDLGYRWEWMKDGCLKAMTPTLPAVATLADGRDVFFNQLIAAFRGWKDERNDPSKSICHGDGAPLDTHGVSTAAALSEELAFDLMWQAGDIVLIDNRVTMHARRPFIGTRKVLASLASMERNEFTPTNPQRPD